jgi:hypothetical protein
MLDAAYIPSLWRVQKTVVLLLVLAVLGPCPLSRMLKHDPTLHWTLAHTRRQRKPHIRYPVRDLF